MVFSSSSSSSSSSSCSFMHIELSEPLSPLDAKHFYLDISKIWKKNEESSEVSCN